MSDTVVEGTLARPDNHVEERPNRAAADPSRVNPALCTYEDAAQHLRPVRGPHGGNQHHPCAVARAKVSSSPYERARAPHKGPNRAARASCTAVLRTCVVVPSTWVTSVPRRPQVEPMGLLYTGATAARWPLQPRFGRLLGESWKSLGRVLGDRFSAGSTVYVYEYGASYYCNTRYCMVLQVRVQF